MALSEKAKNECVSDAIDLDQPTVNAAALSRTQWVSLLTGLDAWFESNRGAGKSAMEAEAGISITAATAKLVGKVWLLKKWGFE